MRMIQDVPSVINNEMTKNIIGRFVFLHAIKLAISGIANGINAAKVKARVSNSGIKQPKDALHESLWDVIQQV